MLNEGNWSEYWVVLLCARQSIALYILQINGLFAKFHGNIQMPNTADIIIIVTRW